MAELNLTPNIIPLSTTTFVVPNVIIIIGPILITAPNAVQSLSRYFYFGLIRVKASYAFPDSFSSILSMSTLCLKDPLTWNDITYPELLRTVGVIR